MTSSLYAGRVTHRRLTPKAHRLAYRVFFLLLDLEELDALDTRLRLFGRNRAALLSFRDRDHLDGSETPLKLQVERIAASAGIDIVGGSVRLLCLPRLLGYVFNPLSVYFCHGADGQLACLLYEVHNTFGERHSYLIPVPAGSDPQEVIRQSCAKCFYVSPFLDMDLTYDFVIRPPGETVSIGVNASAKSGLVIATAFAGTRREISDGTLLSAVLAHPLMTLKVMGGIHWEALRIWLKGIKLRPRPAAPAEPVTTVQL